MTGALWLGPVVALLTVGLLALLLRWAFGGPRMPGPARPAAGSGTDDFGMLRPVAKVPTAAEGNALRAVLSDAQIRSTLVAVGEGRFQVLVFAVDVERARRLIGPAAP